MGDDQEGGSKSPKKPIIVGNVVTGGDFFGREKDIAKFIELLRNGSHVLLVGQRRLGKTSLMLETADRLREEAICLYVDIERCDSSEDMIVKLGKAAHEHRGLLRAAKEGLFGVLRSIRNSIEEVAVDENLKIRLREGAADNWKSMGDRIFDWLSGIDKPVVIFIDELPVFINRIMRDSAGAITPERKKEADIYLSWLRGACIQYSGRITFVAGGSIGIEPVLEQVGMSDHINNFTAFHLQPWDRKTALDFLDDRGKWNGIRFLEGAKERILDKLGIAIPHFVQKFLQNISWDCIDRNAEACASADIDRIYTNNLLAVQGSMELATYVERLERTLGNEKFRLARELLAEAAITGRLTGQAAMILAKDYYSDNHERVDMIRFLLKTFEHDGYLQQDGSDFVFKNNLLKDYWKKEFSFNYIPSNQR
ncbi:MAG: ATP-binding protein [Proteobacteria bacterium]|nr:ATP-binding protein [Pseudomonadota bacterium]